MEATQHLDERGRAALLDRLFRRISSLDDATLTQLDTLTAAEGQGVGNDAATEGELLEKEKNDLTRRGFVLTLLLAGTGAAIGGGAAALLLTQQETPTITGIPADSAPPVPTPGLSEEAVSTIDELNGQIADLNAERLALRAQLNAAREDVTALTTNVSTLNTDLAAAQTGLSEAQARLDAAEADVAYLQELMGIYEQLEAIGLDGLVEAGMGSIGLAILALQGGRDLLESGGQEAVALLETITAQSPTVANGVLWLEGQIDNLAQGLQNLEDALGQAMEPVGPVAAQFGEFLGQAVDALPFGLGEPIRTVLDATTDILTHVPELVANVNPTLVTPLRQWVSPESEDWLIANVAQPITENLIEPAQEVADDTVALETTYKNQFQLPVERALAERIEVRATLNVLQGNS